MDEPTRGLTVALYQAAEAMGPARVPDDVWRRGMRRHRRRRLATLSAAALAVLLVLSLGWAATGHRRDRAMPAGDPRGSVPGRFHRPWPWQYAAVDAPPGPAALLVSGSAGLNMGTFDVIKQGSVLALVGANGAYRVVNDAPYVQAGQDEVLSPDGRYLAGRASLEAHDGPDLGRSISILDLVTGQVRRIPGSDAYGETQEWSPIAWSPDGTRLLVRIFDSQSSDVSGALLLVDTGTGASRRLVDLPGAAAVHGVNLAAFSPDGRQVAVAAAGQLTVMDVADGTVRARAALGGRQRLAGRGAWTFDGRRIAVLSFDGCADLCTAAERNTRTWHVGYLDAQTGAATTGPALAPLTGAALRLVGWQRDGTAVAVRYVDEVVTAEPATGTDGTDYKEVIDVDLVALPTGGGSRVLLATPAKEVWDVDVPADLVLDGRFGGPSPQPAVLPLPGWLWAVLVVGVLLSSVLLTLGWRLGPRRWRRRRRAARRREAPTRAD